ncbi:hypothetical protein XENOCAPTIV_003064, partial [Xenoophorus captivus]
GLLVLCTTFHLLTQKCSVSYTKIFSLRNVLCFHRCNIFRLSEPSMAFICGQLEELYMSCSRKDMNDTLTDVLLAACVTPTLMPDRLLMEHVLLVSVLHHAVGLEVRAFSSLLQVLWICNESEEL